MAAGGTAAKETGMTISEVSADSAVPHIGLCVPKEPVSGGALQEGRGSGFTTDEHYYSSVCIYTGFETNTQLKAPAQCYKQNPGIYMQGRIKRDHCAVHVT